MEISGKSQVNNLRQVFANASKNSGISFDFLIKTAARESSMQPEAKAKSSSAAGLFQFVEQTWLSMVKRYGGRHGLGDEAVAIAKNNSGKFVIADAAVRKKILELRHDPAISTAMAAELTLENKKQLTTKLGRTPSDAELYVAHFMGIGSAGELLNAAKNTPDKLANQMFPTAAKANRSIFFNANGSARSVLQVVDELQGLHAPNSTMSNELNTDYFVGSTDKTADWPLGSGMVRAPLLQLSPALIQLLAELSMPRQSDKN